MQFFCQRGDYAGNLLFLAESWVLGPGLEAGGHHVVDTCEDLHDLLLLAKLIEDIAECLNKPGAAPRVPPRIVPWKSSCVTLSNWH